MIKTTIVKEFRENLRLFERLLEVQNSSGCCCGVTVPQCHVLMELNKQDGISLKLLAGRLGLDKSTVSRTVEDLVSEGLIRREIPPENRRTTRISLTENGTSVCRTINTGNNNYFGKVLEAIPEENLVSFLGSFNAVVERMEELYKSGDNG